MDHPHIAVGNRPGRVLHTIKTFVLKFANDWSMNLASMLAYNLITAIFPILLAILSIAGLVLHGVAPARLTALAGAINRALPSRLHSVIDVTPLLDGLVQITGPLALVTLVSLLWLGGNLFVNMENAFSIVFRVRGRAIIPQLLTAIGMVLVLSVLLPVSLGAASFITAGSAVFRSLLPGHGL